MKTIFKFILKNYLKYITKIVLFIHKPIIIGVAGSLNKTFVKDEINRVLRDRGLEVRSNPRSFNTNIGLPLAILNLPSGYNSYRRWLPIIGQAFGAIFKSFPMHSVLVLELGISDPGDAKYLFSIIKPEIVVITEVTQRYLEGFESMNELVQEYEYLVSQVPEDGLVILNNDNQRVKSLESKIKAEKVFFGFNDGADWRVREISKNITEQIIKIEHEKNIVEYKINRFGEHHVYAKLVGLIIDKAIK